jgi:hypothetical protein
LHTFFNDLDADLDGNSSSTDQEMIVTLRGDRLAQFYKAKLAKRTAQCDAARGKQWEAQQQLDEVTANAVLAGQHIRTLQQKLNAKNDK